MLTITQPQSSEKMKLIFVAPALLAFSIVQNKINPSLELMLWLSCAMAIDLGTGIWKSIILKKARTSTGFQRTVTKFVRYFGSVMVAFMMQRILPVKDFQLPYEMPIVGKTIQIKDLTYFWIFYLIYIEVLSIVENLIAMDKNDRMSTGPLVWIHNILTLQFKNFFSKQQIPPSNEN